MCHTHNKKWKKRQITQVIELQNQKIIRTIEVKQNYNYLKTTRSGHHQISGDKRRKKKNRKMYLRQTRKFLETKLCGRILIKGINQSKMD